MKRSIFAILALIFTFNSVGYSATPEYKEGVNCKDVQEIDYPEGLWCSLDNEGNFYFSKIPYQLDDSQVAVLTKDIEGIDCTQIKSVDCEKLARISATTTIVNKFKLTKRQADDILSCYKFDPAYQPIDFHYNQIEMLSFYERPSLCYWYKYPNVSSAQRFSNLDGFSKFAIIFIVGFVIFLFVIFFDIFNPTKKENAIGGLIPRLIKTLLAIGGIALVIVFGVWLLVVVIEPLFSGTKIDLSKKIFGIPQYMLMILNAAYFIAWNSNKKK